MSYSLSKEEILKDGQDFRRVFSKGRWARGKFIVIYYLPSPQRKVGFAVSRKVSRAVDRNKIRRKLREVYRTKKDLFPKDGMIVILGYEEVIRTPHNVFEKDVEHTIASLKEGIDSR